MKVFGVSLFKNKNYVQKVFISPKISMPEYEELVHNRGYMDEFMRNKNFEVKIDKAPHCISEKCLNIYSSNPDQLVTYTINKTGDKPLIERMMLLLEKLSREYA